MAHHLNTDGKVNSVILSEAWRVTRDVLFLNDLHRNAALYAVVWFLLQLHPYPKHFRTDGTLSVLRKLARSRMAHPRRKSRHPQRQIFWLYYGSRVMLSARRASA